MRLECYGRFFACRSQTTDIFKSIALVSTIQSYEEVVDDVKNDAAKHRESSARSNISPTTMPKFMYINKGIRALTCLVG